MESTSFMSFMSQAENRLGETFRKGQRDIAERFLNSTAVTAQLPTGYGKTRAAAFSYAVLRLGQVANRVLYVVPRGGQATQAANDLPRDLSKILALDFKTHIVGDTPIPAIKAHRSGACELFIATIQSLVSGGAALNAIRDMMQTGKWFIVVDEYHHYGDSEKAWTSKLQSLPHQAILAMSATPYRKDRSDTFGLPDIAIRYRDARELGCVKELDLHAYDYRVDAIVDSRDVQSFTTSQIYKEAGSSNPDAVDRWAAMRELRWSPRYVSPLIKHPIARLMFYGTHELQMIVQAISCSHAKMVCEQIKGLVGPEVNVDWVGTGPRGRTDAENEKIMRDFCPPKNSKGIRPWTLDILVNVGMAGEGLDCIDVCEVVFLNAAALNNSTLQVIGRAARPLKQMPKQIAIINVDTACEMAKYLGDTVETCFDDTPVIPKETGNGGEKNGGGDYPLPPDVIIKDTTDLVDIRTDPHFIPAVEKAVRHPSTAGMAREEIENIVEEFLREGLRRRDAVFNQSAEIVRQKRRVENGCRLKAFQIQGMLRKAGRLQLTEFQDIITRIKTRKNQELKSAPADCSIEELARHMAWLGHLEQHLKQGLPSWLT